MLDNKIIANFQTFNQLNNLFNFHYYSKVKLFFNFHKFFLKKYMVLFFEIILLEGEKLNKKSHKK